MDLVVLFGSAVDSDDPGDIDLALAFGKDSDKDFLADFWERQIFAINHYIETQPLRDALLRSLALQAGEGSSLHDAR